MLYIKTGKILGMLKAGISIVTNFLLNSLVGNFAAEGT